MPVFFMILFAHWFFYCDHYYFMCDWFLHLEIEMLAYLRACYEHKKKPKQMEKMACAHCNSISNYKFDDKCFYFFLVVFYILVHPRIIWKLLFCNSIHAIRISFHFIWFHIAPSENRSQQKNTSAIQLIWLYTLISIGAQFND